MEMTNEQKKEVFSLIKIKDPSNVIQNYKVTEILVAFEDEASQGADLLGYPVNMKIVCTDIPQNRTLIKVQKNIKNEIELREKYCGMMEEISERYPYSSIEGVLIQKLGF